MPALDRYSHPIDGTIPLTALLYDDERLLASQESVGLYDGPSKSPPHQSGAIHVTSHRLFFISGATSASPTRAPSSKQEGSASLFVELRSIRHTDSYAGFLKSSAKITLQLRSSSEGPSTLLADNTISVQQTGETSSVASSSTLVGTARSNTPSASSAAIPVPTSQLTLDTFDVWTCDICGNHNPPGLSPEARNTCQLCGMPRSSSSSVSNTSQSQAISIAPTSARNRNLEIGGHTYSRSLPSSASHTPAPFAKPSLSSSATASNDSEEGPSSIACSTCTFLNHPYLRECEMCGASLINQPSNVGSEAPRIPLSKSAPTSRPGSPDTNDDDDDDTTTSDSNRYIRISFRKGGDKAFYAALKTALQEKAWVVAKTSRSPPSDASSGKVGIHALMENITTNQSSTDSDMQNAFADLSALMNMAQPMVKLAKELNEQLTAATARHPDAEVIEPEEATFVRSSLAQLGLSMKNAPVTADMSRDERRFMEQLARELAGVLLGAGDASSSSSGRGIGQESSSSKGIRKGEEGIMKSRGIIGLDEVWGGWNRARGVSLVSPEQTLRALEYLPQYTNPPINTRSLASGLRVLYTPAFSASDFATRVVGFILEDGPLSTMQVASKEGLNIGLVEELILEAELEGDLCRDEGASSVGPNGSRIEVLWWANAFFEYTWDGEAY